ncbi:MAG: shikimate kinase [Desulfuromonadales bacterium]|nr:shikimate kinase [Desulfuromonadales bacterium]
MPERPVILTGFMGCGKSSVGRKLAESLRLPFIDLDAVIVADAGKSINDIFASEGEAAFRARESACLERVLREGKAVIAGGGGVVVADSNRALMRSRGIVVNLIASLPVILGRLKGATDRPLFSEKDASIRVAALMEERQQFYADADIRIDTDNKSVEDVSALILKILEGLPA